MELKISSINSSWVRYSDYEIIGESIKYIIPIKTAKILLYSPTEMMGRLLADVLNFGKLIFEKQEDNAFVERQCMLFARKYGLLGWITYIPPELSMLQDEMVYIGKNHELFGMKSINSEHYIKFFYPREGKSTSVAPSTIQRDPLFELAFDRNYAEPVLWMADALIGFYSKMSSSTALKGTKSKAIQEDAELYGGAVGFRLSGGANPQLMWEMNSLNAAIELMFSVAMANENAPIRVCKNCQKIYYNENLRSEFCSPGCRNRFNVYKNREKTR